MEISLFLSDPSLIWYFSSFLGSCIVCIENYCIPSSNLKKKKIQEKRWVIQTVAEIFHTKKTGKEKQKTEIIQINKINYINEEQINAIKKLKEINQKYTE